MLQLEKKPKANVGATGGRRKLWLFTLGADIFIESIFGRLLGVSIMATS